MRIYVFGSSIVSAYWNGAATYYRGVFRALSGLGHEIDFCEPDIYDRQANRDLAEDPEYVRVRVYRTEADLAALLEEARGADLVIKCSGVGARDRELEEWVAGVDGPRRAFWDVDAAHTLARIERDPRDPMRRCIPRYDLVLTYGGGPPVIERYRALGARACHPVYNGLDPDVHRPVAPDPELACDVVFMGNRLPDRERRVERFFLDVAAGLPDRHFLLGGSGWADRPLPLNVRWLGHVPTDRHNAINCSARLVLNIHRDAMVANGYSPATRLFEAAGAGACQVTDAWVGIERFFEPGREVLVAETADDVARYIEDVDAVAARAIGAAARTRALRDHSYAGRAQQVDAVLRRVAQPRAHGRRHTGRKRPSHAADRGRALLTPPHPGLSAVVRPRSRGSGMKLVFLGLSITSSWGNGHATTYRGLCRALAARGHRVAFYEWDAPWYGGAHRDLRPDACDYADVRLFGDWDAVRDGLRRDLADADAVLLGSYFRPGIRAAEFLAQEFDGPRFFYDIDTPITVRAYRDEGAAEYLRADQVPLFDVYLSFTGGPVLRELEERYGALRALAFYCAVDPTQHRPRPVRPEFRCALGYMGTYAPDRQPGLESLLLEPARRRPDLSFVVAGPQYPEDVDWPENVRRYEHLPPARHPAFYSSNRLTLNLTRAEMRRWGWSPSVRIFEAAASGTPIVSDRWDGLDRILAPGTEVLLADSADDVVAYLQLCDSELGAIADAARARVLAEHTTAARAERFEAEVERARRPLPRECADPVGVTAFGMRACRARGHNAFQDLD